MSSSSGLLLYAALVDLLAEDFLSEEANRTLTSKDKKLAFFFVLLGGKSDWRMSQVLESISWIRKLMDVLFNSQPLACPSLVPSPKRTGIRYGLMI